MKKGAGKLVFVSQYILAALFLFSGFVKSVDPMGSAIKFTEYFQAFGLGFLTPAAYPLAIALSGTELLLGLCLALGLRVRAASRLVFFFMAFFTALTLVIALTDPVSDCGCFGEAVKLSNWGTFYKNLVFLALAVFVWLHYRAFNPFQKARGDYFILVLLAAFCYGLGIYSAYSLPMVDFLPYKVGVNIPQAMSVPEDAPRDEYETVLVYRDRATGREREFSVEDTTWYDQDKWEYVDTRTELVKKGYRPPIADFRLFGRSGDVTRQVLSDTSYTFVLATQDIDRVPPGRIGDIAGTLMYVLRHRYRLVCITPRPVETAERFFEDRFRISIPCYNVDETTLKSMMRAQTGVLILKGGTIVAKWNLYDTPVLRNKDIHRLIRQVNKEKTTRRLLIVAFVVLLYLGYRISRNNRNEPV